jgi:ABC-2 type transport system ATP-binding protein
MAPTADQLLIIGRGKLITKTSTRELSERLDTSMRELTERFRRDVHVRTPRRGGLTKVLTGMGATVLAEPDGGLSVTGMDPGRIASAAAAHYIPILELTPRGTSFEDSDPELTTLASRNACGPGQQWPPDEHSRGDRLRVAEVHSLWW